MQNDKVIRDVQQQLLSPDGPETVVIPPGEYIVVETIVIPKGRKLMGYESALVADASVSPVIQAEPGVKMEDIRIKRIQRIQRMESFKIGPSKKLSWR